MNESTRRILDLSNFLSEDGGLFDDNYSEQPEVGDETLPDKDDEEVEDGGFSDGNRGEPANYINPLIGKYKPGARQNISPGSRG